MAEAGRVHLRRPLRLGVIVASVVVGGAAAAGVAMLTLGDDSREQAIRGGPLAEPGTSMSEAALMHVGQAGTYGVETVENHGTETAVLERISFVGLTPGLRILGPLALHVRTQPGVPALVTGLVRRFPPPHAGATLQPIAGFRVRPRRSWRDAVELLIGFRPLRTGVLGYRALKLHYRVGDRPYVATYPDPLTICAPFSYPLSRCKAPGNRRHGGRVHSPDGRLGIRLHDGRPEDPDRVPLSGRVLGGESRAEAA